MFFFPTEVWHRVLYFGLLSASDVAAFAATCRAAYGVCFGGAPGEQPAESAAKKERDFDRAQHRALLGPLRVMETRTRDAEDPRAWARAAALAIRRGLYADPDDWRSEIRHCLIAARPDAYDPSLYKSARSALVLGPRPICDNSNSFMYLYIMSRRFGYSEGPASDQSVEAALLAEHGIICASPKEARGLVDGLSDRFQKSIVTRCYLNACDTDDPYLVAHLLETFNVFDAMELGDYSPLMFNAANYKAGKVLQFLVETFSVRELSSDDLNALLMLKVVASSEFVLDAIIRECTSRAHREDGESPFRANPEIFTTALKRGGLAAARRLYPIVSPKTMSDIIKKLLDAKALVAVEELFAFCAPDVVGPYTRLANNGYPLLAVRMLMDRPHVKVTNCAAAEIVGQCVEKLGVRRAGDSAGLQTDLEIRVAELLEIVRFFEWKGVDFQKLRNWVLSIALDEFEEAVDPLILFFARRLE